MDDRDNSEDIKDSEEDKSFVTKVRSRVSGLFNSSISRIFGNQDKRESVIRRRENDEDIYEIQPPCKKARIPLGTADFREDNNGTLTHLYGMNSLGDASSTIFTNLIEPVAGPSDGNQKGFLKKLSSISTPKEINEEKDSDSGESTSGYSSMPRICSRDVVRPVIEPKSTAYQNISGFSPEKEAVPSKRLFNNLTPERSSRSLFAESSLSPVVKNKSLSSRRPSTSTSNFGSPNFIDRTVTTNRIINSPFYNGPTVYGGASAYNSLNKLSESRKQQLKNSFIVKPVNKQIVNNSCTSLSKTARRILSALEQYSVPMMDAEKIPLPTKSEKKEGLLSKYVGVNPYRLRDSRVSSNRELLVPSVPERLRMKQKQRFQDTTDKIRQIATSSKISSDSDYKICEDNQQKYTNKIKTKVSSVRAKAPAVEILENIVLKPVPLTIPENKLPKFDLVIPPPDSLNSVYTQKKDIKACVESTVVPSQKSETKESKGKDYVTEFTFAKPVVIADNLKSVVAINNFKFSEPLSKRMGFLENQTMLVTKETEVKETKTGNGASSVNFLAQNSVKSVNNGKDLMEKFKAPEGSWSCSTCLLTNKKDATKCIACETLRSNQTVKKGVEFNEKADQWECSTCLIKNNNQHTKCVACSSLKVSKNTLKSNGFENKKWDNETRGSNRYDHQNVTSGFGEKFKPASDTWECQTCLVRNKANVERCVACESKREKIVEKTFQSLLTSSKDTWECDTCLIRNKNEIQNCAACQTPKEKVFISSGTDNINKISNKWECSTCLVKNESNVEKCVCCETPKAGVTLINKNTVNMFNFGVNNTQFNFGIPKVESDSLKTPSGPPLATSIDKSSSEILPKSSDSSSENKTNVSSVGEQKNQKDGVVTPVMPSISDKNMKAPVFTFGSSNTPIKFGVDAGSKPPSVNSDATNLSSFTSTTSTSSTKNLDTNISPKTTNSVTFGTPKALMHDTARSDTIVSGSTPTAVNLLDNQKSSIESKFPAASESKMAFDFEKKNTDSSIPFGKTENSASAINPMFTFGSSTPSTKGFSFNSNTVTPKVNSEEMTQKSTGGFTFNKPKTDTNIFDAAVPVNAKNGGFNFGNAPVTNNQAAVFSFGATQNSPQAKPNLGLSSQGGFNFSSPAAPMGGFNFTQSAPTFDASIKPSFNFTGGTTPTFAATPTEAGGGPTNVRKFKKAVRRAAQR